MKSWAFLCLAVTYFACPAWAEPKKCGPELEAAPVTVQELVRRHSLKIETHEGPKIVFEFNSAATKFTLKIPKSPSPVDLFDEVRKVGVKLELMAWLRENGASLLVIPRAGNGMHIYVQQVGDPPPGREQAPAMKWLRKRMQRSEVTLHFDDSDFANDTAKTLAKARERQILMRTSQRLGGDLRGIMAHELKHAVNFVLCRKLGICGPTIWFKTADEAGFAGIPGGYEHDFRSDEFEAWYLQFKITRDEKAMAKAVQFLRQIRWLELLAQDLRTKGHKPDVETKFNPEREFKNKKFELFDGANMVQIEVPVTEDMNVLDIVEERLRQLKNILRAKSGLSGPPDGPVHLWRPAPPDP